MLEIFLPTCPSKYLHYFRYASYWDVPVITTGGMEDTFRDKTSEYGSLTCLGGDYDQFAMFFRLNINALYFLKIFSIFVDKYFIFSLNRLVLDYIYSSRRRSEIKIRNPFKDLKLIEKSLVSSSNPLNVRSTNFQHHKETLFLSQL